MKVVYHDHYVRYTVQIGRGVHGRNGIPADKPVLEIKQPRLTPDRSAR